MFIGYYNKANIVTLLGLVFSFIACIVASLNGVDDKDLIKWAVVLFLASGLCDMFDGRIARGSGSRTRKEKIFGIQIDSLCDMVSFGVTPAIISYFLGYKGIETIACYALYVACAAIRLAYFNTQALTETSDLNMKSFTGVPVPFSCLFMPVLVILHKLLPTSAVRVIFDIVFLAVGLAFIAKVKIKKLRIVECMVLIVFELACIILMFLM